MERKYLTLREIQLEETKMLGTLIEFFKENNLTYYVWAGTFLGAVRHHGFIPWDDDIDLAMTRPEYNKMLEIIKKNNYKINDELEFIGYELNNSDFPFIKIINKNICVDEQESHDEFLWVDIFPLDGMPKMYDKFFDKTQNLKRKMYLKRKQMYKEPIPSSSLLTKLLKIPYMFMLRFCSYDKMLAKFYKLCTQINYDESEYIKNHVWTDSKAPYKKEDFVSCEYEFEGLKVNGVKDYDTFLSAGYGKNYMELPPEEKRITHEFKAWKKEN